jgi:hypothetical protein
VVCTRQMLAVVCLLAPSAPSQSSAVVPATAPSKHVHWLDVDPVQSTMRSDRIRLQLRANDVPRRLVLSSESDICLALQASESGHLVAQVRRLSSAGSALEWIQVGGTGVEPGTFRTTSWGLLLRLVVSPSFGSGGAREFDRELDASVQPPCEL